MSDSLTEAYAERLKAHLTWLRVMLRVQAPYRWNLRRLKPGYTLDLGCGLGRNLAHIDGNGVGVDPNPACLREALAAGFTAYSPEGFAASAHARPGGFDTLLVAHVLEHMDETQARELLAAYVGYVRPGGQLILITPQELGFEADDTHVHYMDAAALVRLAEGVGTVVERNYSFPFPRWLGRIFRYQEFVVTARIPSLGATEP
jgi:SAM-dependent methyltransferase